MSALADHASIAIENARLLEQVRQHAGELEARVDMRTRELQEANERLEQASRHKSEFLANMSHELRTPLNAIIGFTRLVMRRTKEIVPAKQYENLEKILISSDNLLRLINDILDLSKIEAGRMEVSPVAVDLHQLVDACLRTVEPLVKSERLRLVKGIPDGHADAVHRQEKLQQILINLLSNAVKFTDEGTITVSARRQGRRVLPGGVRHRNRHPAGSARADLRGVPPGGQQQHAQIRRDRPGAFHQPAFRAPAGRGCQRGEHAGRGFYLHRHNSRSATSRPVRRRGRPLACRPPRSRTAVRWSWRSTTIRT